MHDAFGEVRTHSKTPTKQPSYKDKFIFFDWPLIDICIGKEDHPARGIIYNTEQSMRLGTTGVPRSDSDTDLDKVKSNIDTPSGRVPPPPSTPPVRVPSNLFLKKSNSTRSTSGRRIAMQVTLEGGPLADGSFSYVDPKGGGYADETLTVVERVRTILRLALRFHW